jgi:ribonuclease-3
LPDLVVIFRTSSEVEASVVRGLLEAHGIPSIVTSGLASVLPIGAATGGVQIAVNHGDAEEAARLIASHRTELDPARVVRLRDEFGPLQQAIGYRFRDRGLLEHAMTHTSRAHEDVSGGVRDNESLEFLGDAVLGFVVADLLFREFPEYDEGQKSKAKASLVSTTALARQADRLQLGDHLLLGRGEEKTGGRRKQALLADGYEALIASMYLDGGIDQARAFIVREFRPLIDALRAEGVPGRQDYKSTLQELLQARQRPLPEYRLTGTAGPDHRKEFEVTIVIGGESIAMATGASKKDAEQEAARRAIQTLEGLRDEG